MRLDGKVTLITGGASGQGRVAAVEFARAGSAIVVADIDATGLAETIELVVAEGGAGRAVVGSVAEAGDVDRMVTTAVDVFGHLDVLYNNAAIYLPGRGDAPVADLEEGIWQQVLDVNLKGVYLCAKRAIPELRRAGGGAIVNIASLGGTRGSRSAHAYAAAKGGVIALTYSMAVTYGPDNIRVNAIAPGAIDTPMLPRLDDDGLARMRDHTPLGRIGTPAEVARVALFLASDAAAYITGTVQIVDGGFTIG
jgi:NAD(P)-dependent dehydrogenase (short-subunit alcohol dehydrogenase family)